MDDPLAQTRASHWLSWRTTSSPWSPRLRVNDTRNRHTFQTDTRQTRVSKLNDLLQHSSLETDSLAFQTRAGRYVQKTTSRYCISVWMIIVMNDGVHPKWYCSIWLYVGLNMCWPCAFHTVYGVIRYSYFPWCASASVCWTDSFKWILIPLLHMLVRLIIFNVPFTSEHIEHIDANSVVQCLHAVASFLKGVVRNFGHGAWFWSEHWYSLSLETV